MSLAIYTTKNVWKN